MAKKKIVFEIAEINVHVCNHGGVEQKEAPNPVQEMVDQVKEMQQTIRGRTVRTLTFVDKVNDTVKNDSDFRTLIDAILNKKEDVILETPEATALFKELQESGHFGRQGKGARKEEPTPQGTSQNGL